MLETHKTAGAAYNLGQRLEEVGRGRYRTILRLRKGDNLVELETAFNEMSRRLTERTWDEVEKLNQFAAEAARLDRGEELAAALRRMVTDKRGQVG